MAKPEIAVTGMKELRKALREFDDDNGWRGPLKEAYGSVSTLVEREARSLAGQPRSTLGGTVATMGSKAVASIKGKGTTTAATLAAFRGIPYGPGWNFGSHGGISPRGVSLRRFPAVTEPDYSLYASIKATREQINNEFLDVIEAALDQAFPD